MLNRTIDRMVRRAIGHVVRALQHDPQTAHALATGQLVVKARTIPNVAAVVWPEGKVRLDPEIAVLLTLNDAADQPVVALVIIDDESSTFRASLWDGDESSIHNKRRIGCCWEPQALTDVVPESNEPLIIVLQQTVAPYFNTMYDDNHCHNTRL